MEEAVGVKLKMNFEHRRSGWGNEENKAACFECGGTDRFKALCPIWIAKRRKMEGCPATPQSQNENGKGKAKGKKGKSKSSNFTCLETQSNGEKNEEQEVNIATRQVNLPGVSGAGQWGEKDWPKECSSIVDTGCNGGGLRSHAWM